MTIFLLLTFAIHIICREELEAAAMHIASSHEEQAMDKLLLQIEVNPLSRFQLDFCFLSK